MSDFLDDGFVISDSVRFGEPKGGYVAVEGEIRCLGGITITVDKKLTILRGKGPTAIVRTAEYSYNVHVEGRGNLFRYCAPDGHRPHHHVHRYDNRGEALPVEDFHYSDDIPHLSDVIDEARELWYSMDL